MHCIYICYNWIIYVIIELNSKYLLHAEHSVMKTSMHFSKPLTVPLRCWCPWSVYYWYSFVNGLSRLLSSRLGFRCFLRFILDKSLSNTSPERRADTRSSNSPPSSSLALAFFAFCSLSLFNWRRKRDDDKEKIDEYGNIHYTYPPMRWSSHLVKNISNTFHILSNGWFSSLPTLHLSTCLLTCASMSARFSSSSLRLAMFSLSCLASKKAVRNMSNIPKKSSGCRLDGSSPKCLSAFPNFNKTHKGRWRWRW